MNHFTTDIDGNLVNLDQARFIAPAKEPGLWTVEFPNRIKIICTTQSLLNAGTIRDAVLRAKDQEKAKEAAQ